MTKAIKRTLWTTDLNSALPLVSCSSKNQIPYFILNKDCDQLKFYKLKTTTTTTTTTQQTNKYKNNLTNKQTNKQPTKQTNIQTKTQTSKQKHNKTTKNNPPKNNNNNNTPVGQVFQLSQALSHRFLA